MIGTSIYKRWISSVGAACMIMALFVCLAGCGGGGGGNNSTVKTLGYTLTGKVVLPDGSSGPNILVMASRVEESGVSRKQARVLAAGPDDRRDFVNTLQTIKNDQSGTYATTTDAEGVYMLNGLKEGTYFIEASRGSMKATSRASVSPTEASVVDLALTPTGGITGYCLLQGAGYSGNAGTFVVIKGTDYIGFTDDDGSFTLDQIPVDSYQVSFVHPGYESQNYPSSVSVPTADLADLDAVYLTPLSGGTISGMVTAQDQEPLEEVMVVVEDAAGGQYFTVTDDLGEYRVDGVNPGAVTVGFKHDLIDAGYMDDDETVAEGDITTVNAALTDEKTPVWESTPGVVYVTEIDPVNGGAATPAETSTISAAVEFGRALDASSPLTFVIYHNTVESWDADNWENNYSSEVTETYDGIRGEQGAIIEGLDQGMRYIFGVRVRDRHENLEYNRSEYLFVAGDDGPTVEERDNLLTAVGNIGIGTKDPQGLLHVEAESGSAFVVDGETGNVGIGTTDPHAALTVGSSDQQQTQTSSSSGTFAVDSNGNVISGAWQGDAIVDDYIETVSGSKIVGDIPASQLSGSIPASQITGDIPGNAAGVTGVVPVEKGGTGAATAEQARTNLGIDSLTTTVSGGPGGSIEDGTITTDDISSQAAIDFAKLNIGKTDITNLGIPGEDADTTYSAGLGITLENTTFSLDQQGAASGQVLKWDGSAWTPAVDTDTDSKLTDSDIATMGYIKTWTETDPAVDLAKLQSLVQNDFHALGGTDADTQLSDSDIGTMGYIKSYTETDPTVDLAKLQGLVQNDFHVLGGTDADTQLSDSDIGTMGYIKSYTETDPTVDLAKLQTLVQNDFHALGGTDADTQLSDSDIGALGYIKSWTETDPTVDLTKLQTVVDNDFHALGGTDANTQLSDNEIGAMGYIKTDNDTTYTAGDGLSLTNTEFTLAQQDAGRDQVLKWNGTGWAPSDDVIGLSGTGTDNYLPRYLGIGAVETSVIYQDDNGNVGIGVEASGASLEVGGPVLIIADGVTFEVNENIKVEASGSTITNAVLAASTGTGTVGSGTQGVFGKAYYNGTSTATDFILMPVASGVFGRAATGTYESINSTISVNAVGVSGSATTAQLGSNTGVIGTAREGVHRNIGMLSLTNLTDQEIIAAYTGLPAGFSAGLYANNSLTGTNDYALYVPSTAKSYLAGNVGIGTEAPGDMLHVNGGLIVGTTTGTIAGTIRFNDGSFEGYSGSEWKALDDQGTGGSVWTEPVDLNLIYYSGDVGIGKTDPSVALDVNGTVNMTQLSIGGTAVTAAAVEINYVNGVTGDIQTQLDAKAPAASPTFTGSVTVGDFTLPVGDGTADQVLKTDGAGTVSWSTTAAGGSVWTEPGDLNLIYYSGNVGIGKTDASVALDVNGTIDMTTLSLGGTAVTATATELNFVDGVTSAVQTQLDAKAPAASPTLSGEITLPGGVWNSDGMIGIGTNSPSDQLTVYEGGIGVQGTDPYITLVTSNSSQTAGLAFNDSWGGGTARISTSGMNLNLRAASSGSDHITVKSNGRVGIGTADPAQSLEVVGEAAAALTTPLYLRNKATPATGNGVGIRFGAASGASATVGQAVIRSDVVAAGTGDGTLVFSTFQETGEAMKDWMIITQDGNVGIGTTAPGGDATYRMLEIEGGDPAIILDDVGGDHTDDLKIWNRGSMVYFRDQTDNIDIMVFDLEQSAATVGIGTTVPGSTLDVKGTLRLSGATSGYVGLAPAAEAGSTTFTLPAADGTSGQVLSTNGSGALSWANAGGGPWTEDTGFIKFSGDVGVGTTDPGSDFAVSGAAAIGAGYYETVAPTNGLLVEGNVGIGTTNPGGQLEIKGISSGSDYALSVLASSSAAIFKVRCDGNASFYGNPSSAVRLKVGGSTTDSTKAAFEATDSSFTSLFYVRNDGNIGIGSTTPGSTLDVKGTLRLSGATSGYVGLAPAAEAGSTTFTLPAADGTSGQVLSTNGSGTLTWATAGGASALTDLSDVITDNSSVFLGTNSGASDDGSNANTAVGIDAMKFITTGVQNTVVGRSALNTATSGRDNAVLGTYALYSTTTGEHNNALGSYALQYNTIGNRNIGVGFEADRYNQEGENNTIIGHQAGRVGSNHNKSNCVIIGAYAGYGSTATGSGNIFMGYMAGTNESGSNKLYIENSNADKTGALIYGEFDNDLLLFNADVGLGTTAPGSKFSVAGNAAIGSTYSKTAAPTDGMIVEGNVGIGVTDPDAELEVAGQVKITGGTPGAGKVLTSDANGLATWETASGASALDDLSDAISDDSSVFLGSNSGVNDDGTTNKNVAVGVDALNANTSGANNIGIGYYALKANTTGGTNVAVGNQSLNSNVTGTNNTAFGDGALRDNTAGSNTAVGGSALLANTSGTANTGVGLNVLNANTIGNFNTALGYNALGSNTTGGKNIALGVQAGQFQANGSTTLLTPENSVYIGYDARGNDDDDNNSIVIGYQAAGLGANTVVLGNNSITTTALKGNVGIGTTSPGAKLEVNGQVKITGGTPGAGKVLTSDAAGLATWETASGAAALNDLSDSKTDASSVFLGSGSGTNDDGTTNKNVALGVNTLTGNTSGYENVAVGYNTLTSNTTGYDNVAVGFNALDANTDGSFNVAVGRETLSTCTSAGYNTALGMYSLKSTTTGQSNTAVGANAMYFNEGGGSNVAVGRNSLYNNTSGSNNVAVGLYALRNNTTALGNVAVGPSAGELNETGYKNVFVGNSAGYNALGGYNVFIGSKAGYAETGEYKLYIDSSNDDASTPLIYGEFDNDLLVFNADVGLGTTAPGAKLEVNGQVKITGGIPGAGKVLTSDADGLATWETAAGASALNDLSDVITDVNSVFIGSNSGATDDGDNYNVGIGFDALSDNTAGIKNTAVGYRALDAVTGAGSDNNTAIGYHALRLTTSGTRNTAVGVSAAYTNGIGTDNVAVGYNSLYTNWQGDYNVAIGNDAAYSATSANSNVAVGYHASYYITTGSNNTAVGSCALRHNTTGLYNVAVGYNAGRLQSDGMTFLADPENSIYIGYNAKGLNNDDDNSIVIGYDAVGLGANTVVLGNDSIVTTVLKGSVGIGTTAPSSKLEVNGAIATAVVTIINTDSPYTPTSSDSVILVNAGGGAVTVTLPAASTCKGRMYTIKKTDSTANVVTISRSGSDYIDASTITSIGLSDQSKYFTVISNGVDAWFIISEGLGVAGGPS